MKKVFSLMVAGLLSVTAVVAQVEFTWGTSVDLVSAYLWRGQYLGGLSIQPEVSIGFEGEHTSLSVGAWGNYGFSDWKFSKNNADEALDTYMIPELDLFVDFGFYGVHLGATHYYYFGGTKFFNGFKEPEEGGSQTEVWLGYHFADEFDFGLYIDAYTFILGDDGEYVYCYPFMGPATDKAYNRYFSTYVELGYEIALPMDFTLTPVIGAVATPTSIYTEDSNTWQTWKQLGFTNLSLRLDKTWELGEHTSLGIFALGSVNLNGIDKDNLWLNTSGEYKVGYNQKLNGCIGVNISFE